MFLKSIEIQGFKSFPDKTVLTFGKGITAVVGPNGSGKSNISDAIRWVMGEVSSKALRGTRMEDVIFGGAVNRKPLGFAEVSLTVDNSGRELDYDSDDVKITRRYYRSGESEYLLCGKDVRLRDIHELLMDTGLGRDGYSIIGQGRIDEIVGAKSEDRREIFEEAAGISKYRYRKEESERRLADAEENLVRLRDILSELEARVGPLREQSEKAKQYLELAGEKKTLEVGLWLHTLDKTRDVLREQENRLNYARAQYDAVSEKLEKTQGDIEAAYLEAQRKAAEIESLRKTAQELEESAVKKQAQADILNNDILHNNENIERINKEITEASMSGGESDEKLQKLKVELENKLSESKELEQKLADCENGVNEILQKTEGLSGKIEDAAARLTALSMKLSDVRIEKNGALSSIAQLKERGAAIEGDAASRNLRIAEAEKLLGESKLKITEREESIESLKNELKGYELKLNSRKEKLSRIDETVRSFSLQCDGKKQRAAMLEDLERNLEGFSHSVKIVMREKQHGRLAGIHAPVSKLISVPRDYSVAVETALGFSAQHIVVDSEEDAKAAIGMLKRSDGGRVTFLPISSVHGNMLSERELSGENGFVGIASELVNYDAKYTGIVRSLLGRTAVADDLDCAVRIARRFSYRFRIVTLDGQLVNAGGSMTGGSANRNTGLLSRTGEIETLRKEAETIAARIESFNTEKKTLAEQASGVEAKLHGIRGELTTAQEDKIRLEGERRRFEEQLAALKLDTDALKKEKQESAARIAEFERTVSVSDEKINELTLNIESVQREAEALGADRGKFLKLREESSRKLNSFRLDAVACEKDAAAIRQEIGGIELRRRGDEEKISQLRQQILQLEDKNNAAQGSIAKLISEAQTLRKTASEKVEGSGKSAKERDEIEKSTAQLRSLERGFSEEKEKISKELARLDERRAGAQSEYDTVIARLLDEYELTRSEAEKIAPKIEDVPGAQKRLAQVKNSIKSLGSINVGAIEEYKEVSKRYDFMKTQTDDVEKSKRELSGLISGLTDRMREIFSEQFKLINDNFSHTFVELFGGGSASLELSEPDDVLLSGIEIIVQPPGKIIKNLSMLSGGERAFVAIALYFAILKVRPSPFCVLDEIEAALDDANVARYAAYLRRMCGETQFIVITHRRGTMDEADTLYGVTMQDEGVSKLLTLDVDGLVERLGIK